MNANIAISITAAGLLSACTVISSVSQQSDEAISARSELAQSLVAGGNFSAAVRLYEGLASDYPYDPAPILKLGDLHLNSNDLMRATAAYDDALSRGAGAAGHVGHGRIALKRNDSEEAITAFANALAYEDESFDALNGMGVAYDLIGAHTDAQQKYREAIEISPDSQEAFNNLALSLSLSGDFAQATSIMQRLVSSPSVSESERLNLSFINALAGQSEETWSLTPNQSKEQRAHFLDFWFDAAASS